MREVSQTGDDSIYVRGGGGGLDKGIRPATKGN